jgi:hypothetical protein
VQITTNIGFQAFESSDGAYVYYTQTQGAPSALWRVPASGGQPVRVLEGVIQRAFTVLEKGIYYIDQPAGDARLQFYDFAAGRSTTVARNPGGVELGLTALSTLPAVGSAQVAMGHIGRVNDTSRDGPRVVQANGVGSRSQRVGTC